jgi:sec-independent protein translocase protein TatB
MFGLGWGEMVVIGIVALIAIGPKELPGVLRTLGQYMGKVRRMAAEFQGQFQEALREAELEDTHKSLTSLNETASSFNPIQTIRDEIKSAVEKDSATSAAPPPPEPALDVPEPPPVPDLTPEQIRAAFAPDSSTAIEDFYVPSPEPAADAAAEEKPKRARRKKAAETGEAAAGPEAGATAPEPRKRAPRKKTAKADPAAGEGEEGTGA